MRILVLQPDDRHDDNVLTHAHGCSVKVPDTATDVQAACLLDDVLHAAWKHGDEHSVQWVL